MTDAPTFTGWPGHSQVGVDLACQSAAFSTDPFSTDFAESLPVLREAGYSRVALGPVDPSNRNLAELGQRIRDAGLTPIAMALQSLQENVASPSASVRRRGVELLRRCVEMTEQLGADQLTGVTYGVHGDTSGRLSASNLECVAQLVGSVADEAAASNIMMTFEVVNRYETSVLNTAADAVEFVELSGSRHLKIHLDTFHMAIEETDMTGAIAHALPHLGYLEFGQSARGLLSTGSLDLSGVLKRAKAMGYIGRYGVEGFSRQTMAGSVADNLKIWGVPFETGEDFARDAASFFS